MGEQSGGSAPGPEAPVRPREVAEAYWRDECLRDVDLVLSHYHPDGEFRGPNGRALVGHDEIRTFYEASCAAFPGLAVEIVAGIEDGDRGAFEFVAELTDADGRVYPARGTNMVVVRDGKFVSNHSYFDTSELS